MNGIMVATGMGAMVLAAMGSLVGPPAAGVEDQATVVVRGRVETTLEQAETTSPGKWEVKLQPLGTLRIVVNGRSRHVFLNDSALPADRVLWQPDDRVTVYDESRQRQFQVALEQNGGIRVRPGNWLEYAADDAPRVAIGIYTEPLLPPLAEQLRLDPDATLLITAVVENMPAAKSGVRVFDVITGVDDETRVTQATLERVVRVKEPGESVRLQLVRHARPLEISVATQEVKPIKPSEFDLLGTRGMPNTDLVIDFETLESGDAPIGFFREGNGQQMLIQIQEDQALFYPSRLWNNLHAPAGTQRIMATRTTSDLSGMEARLDQLTARIASLEALLRRRYSDDPRFSVPRY